MQTHNETNLVAHLELTVKTLLGLQASQNKLSDRVALLEKENSALKVRLMAAEGGLAPAAPAVVGVAGSTIQTSKPGDISDIALEKEKARAKAALTDTPQTVGYAIETGVQMIMQLPSELQPKYSKLMRKPPLIVENLLMDGRVDLLRAIQDLLESQHLDILALEYAQHAMRIRGDKLYDAALKDAWQGGKFDPSSRAGRRSGSLSRSGSISVAMAPSQQQPASMEWKLTGDPTADEKTRSLHVYPSTPDSQLATDILSLCQDSSKAAYACLSVRVAPPSSSGC